MIRYLGPTTIRCPRRCEVPEGVIATAVPPPRHAWSDVHRCPNDGCGLGLLIQPDATGEEVTVAEGCRCPHHCPSEVAWETGDVMVDGDGLVYRRTGYGSWRALVAAGEVDHNQPARPFTRLVREVP